MTPLSCKRHVMELTFRYQTNMFKRVGNNNTIWFCNVQSRQTDYLTPVIRLLFDINKQRLRVTDLRSWWRSWKEQTYVNYKMFDVVISVIFFRFSSIWSCTHASIQRVSPFSKLTVHLYLWSPCKYVPVKVNQKARTIPMLWRIYFRQNLAILFFLWIFVLRECKKNKKKTSAEQESVGLEGQRTTCEMQIK